MLQSFEVSSSPETGAERLAALRAQMAAVGVDGFLIPRADAHQGEYVAPRDQRLAWLTGFTGSAGFCAALMDRAGVFIDGRYTLQIRDQVDLDHFTPVDWPKNTLGNWLAAALPDGGKVAYDPWHYTPAQIEQIQNDLGDIAVELIASSNLIDAIWDSQPDAPNGAMVPHDLAYAGRTHEDKILNLSKGLQSDGDVHFILTQPDSIAWLLNTRGSDIDRIPVTLCFAVLHAKGRVTLLIDPSKLNEEVRIHLGDLVDVESTEYMPAVLGMLKGRVRLDKQKTPMAILDQLKNASVEYCFAKDPTSLPKAAKNAAEIAGARSAHIRDGAAVVEFLAWLDSLGDTPNISEIDVVEKLEGFRRDTDALKDISFETIAGSGPNGAIVHYRVNRDTNRQVQAGDILLVDSGAQYLDGTTDITRTLAIGTPPADAVMAATLVLKGMIAISRLQFPAGLAGRDLDAHARSALWAKGMDFDHGTGHGVGSYLSVHEGPQGISKRSTTPLEKGMILSNEPGYYRAGKFGIRIENLITVTAAKAEEGREMFAFETLTLAPIDAALIDTSLMTRDEIQWLDTYHDRVRETLRTDVSPTAQAYLDHACQPLWQSPKS